MEISLSKIKAAEIQLNEAVYLFFDGSHPIVIEALAMATTAILRPLARKYGINARLHDHDRVIPEKKKEWGDCLDRVQRFCTLAEKAPEAILTYETQSVRYQLLEACYLFRVLSADKNIRYHQSNPGFLYEIWFALEYPQMLKNPEELYPMFALSKLLDWKDRQGVRQVLGECRIK